MKLKILFFLVTAVFFTGCKTVLMKMYGIRDPKVESSSSVRRYAVKTGLDTASIATVNAADFHTVLKQADGIPNAAVFNRDGEYIEYRATDTSCNAGLFGFIPELSPDRTYKKTGRLVLGTEWKKMRTLYGQALPGLERGAYDFYILIYWTTWTGRLNKDHVREWQELAKANKAAKIKVIEVNLDVHSYWPKEDQEKTLKSFGKKK